jgi:sensor histidine kinase YesM
VWGLIFYFVFAEMREVIEENSFKVIIEWFEYHSFILTITSLTAFIGFSWGAYWIFRQLYGRIPLFWAFPALLLNILVFTIFRFFLQERVVLFLFGFGNYHDNLSYKYYLFDNLYYAVIFTALGVVFYFIQYSKYKEQQQQELLLQNKQTELAFLRSQINPHFLFNTLNNIYTLVYQKSDNALKAMDKLTSILRYALYEPHHMVKISTEIKYIEDFIALQQLRYDFKTYIDFHVDVKTLNHLIPPFSLIPFVENAFKHGHLKDENHPFIFHCKKENEQVIFTINNQIAIQEKDKTGGIGLENIKKRLALIYQQEHELLIKKMDDQFSVTLKIPLDEY